VYARRQIWKSFEVIQEMDGAVKERNNREMTNLSMRIPSRKMGSIMELEHVMIVLCAIFDLTAALGMSNRSLWTELD